MLLIQQGSNWCPWCGGHMGWWGGWMMMFWWLLILAILAVAWWRMRHGGWASGPFPRSDRSEGILRERFARGEIDEATYQQQLAALKRSGS